MSKKEQALKYMQEQNYEEAAKLWIELMESEKEDPSHFLHFGQLLFQTKQYEEAERFFLKAISLNETIPEHFYSLGNLYYETELFDDAVKMFHHTMKLGLSDSDVNFMLGMSYVQKNNITLSLPYLQRSTELDPTDEKLFQYGLSLAKLNYLQEAETQFLMVLQKNAKHIDARYNLSIIYVHEGKLEQAENILEQILQEEPNHSLAKEAYTSLQKQK